MHAEQLLRVSFDQEASLEELLEELPGRLRVNGAGAGARDDVVADVEGLERRAHVVVPALDVRGVVLAGLLRGDRDRDAVIVGARDREDVLTAHPKRPHVDVGRQVRARDVPEMKGPVGVEERGGDEGLAHVCVEAAGRAGSRGGRLVGEKPRGPVRSLGRGHARRSLSGALWESSAASWAIRRERAGSAAAAGSSLSALPGGLGSSQPRPDSCRLLVGPRTSRAPSRPVPDAIDPSQRGSRRGTWTELVRCSHSQRTRDRWPARRSPTGMIRRGAMFAHDAPGRSCRPGRCRGDHGRGSATHRRGETRPPFSRWLVSPA